MCVFYQFLGRNWPKAILKVSLPKRTKGWSVEATSREGTVTCQRKSGIHSSSVVNVFLLPSIQSCAVTQRTLTPYPMAPVPLLHPHLICIESHNLVKKHEEKKALIPYGLKMGKAGVLPLWDLEILNFALSGHSNEWNEILLPKGIRNPWMLPEVLSRSRERTRAQKKVARWWKKVLCAH